MKVKQVESVSRRLSQALNSRNYKQNDLASLTNIAKSSISLYMSGKYEPKADKIFLMAKALNVSPEWLSGFDVPMNRDSDTDAESSKEYVNGDAELTEYLEELKNRKEMRMLFKVAKGATKQDVEKAVAIIEALRRTDDEI